MPASPSDRPEAAPTPVLDWKTVRRLGHDLNNLLGAIGGYTEMVIEDSGPEAPTVPDLRRIAECAKEAAALVEQLMTLANPSTVPSDAPSQANTSRDAVIR